MLLFVWLLLPHACEAKSRIKQVVHVHPSVLLVYDNIFGNIHTYIHTYKQDESFSNILDDP